MGTWKYHRENYRSLRSAVESVDKKLLGNIRIQFALWQIGMAEQTIDQIMEAHEKESPHG